jgi:hypothetical protein
MKKLTIAFIFLCLLSTTLMAQQDIPVNTDMLVTDDLFVNNSIGVGFDMAVGYSFGFNTIVMRENNTRLFFEDTSVPPFPATDWLLEANSSVSGGGEYFRIVDVTTNRIPFTVEGNTPNWTIYGASSGKVGFGTSSPALDLHISKGDTPGIRLDQNGSAGYSAQSWDIAGNESNFFIRDVTYGSLFPFRIRPGTPSNTLTLNNTGNVGVGTYTPGHKLEVAGDARVDSFFYFGDAGADGNWRVSVVAGDLTFEKKEAGVWVTKVKMQ